MIHSTAEAPSFSRAATRSQCERKYFYSYHRKLEPSTGFQFPPAFMGSALHGGLEAFHRSGSATQALSSLSEMWGWNEFHGDWNWVTLGHAEIVLKYYMESKHTQDWEIVKIKRSDLKEDKLVSTDVKEDDEGYLVLAEATFVVDMPGMGPLTFRPDLVLQTISGMQVVDHKTSTGYLGSKLYNRAKYSHQLRSYCLGMGALLGEDILEGGVNAIYTGQKAGTDKFGGRRFDYFTFDYSAADFQETKEWFKINRSKMKYMKEHFTDDDEFSAPQNPGDHCGYCEFAPLCIAPAALRPGIIKREYRRKQ